MKQGGKREGAGRKPSENPANKMVTVKLTPRQYAEWVKLGAGRWVKQLLDLSIDVDKEQK